jgi:hypothetical protein
MQPSAASLLEAQVGEEEGHSIEAGISAVLFPKYLAKCDDSMSEHVQTSFPPSFQLDHVKTHMCKFHLL